MAASQGGLTGAEIRVLTRLEEFERTLEIQQEVWGFSDRDKVPPRLMMVAAKIGGLVLGLFEGGRMVGYSFAIPGKKPAGEPFLHSHMTGLLPAVQNQGLGRRLKLRQRDEALRLGYDLIEWTFDPLEVRNCFFNFERLGVVARRYEPNVYGITSSHLHGRLPTDRLVAEWRLESERVVGLLNGPGAAKPAIDRTVVVPATASQLRNSDSGHSVAEQTRIRESLQEAFGLGLAIVGYRRVEGGGEFELGRLPHS